VRVVLRLILPCGDGVHLPFIDQGEGELQSCRTVLATWGSMVCSAAELAAVLTVLATVLSSWRVLYSNSRSFEGKGTVVGRGFFRRARGSR
jgi:hypothetical protein